MPQFVSTCVSTVLLTGPFIACFFILESKVAKYLFNSWNIWQHYKETEQILVLNEPKGHSPPEVFIFVSLFPKSQRCLSQPWLISVWGDNVLCTWEQAYEPGKGMKPMLIRENVMNFLHSPKPPVEQAACSDWSWHWKISVVRGFQQSSAHNLGVPWPNGHAFSAFSCINVLAAYFIWLWCSA